MNPTDILANTRHRPYTVPARPWKYYQEWNATIFLHYKVDADLLQTLLPKGLSLDLYEKEAWVTVALFSVNGLRPHWLPPLAGISNFHEVNIRTYVVRQGVPGIFFLLLDASKRSSATLGRIFGRLPYEKGRCKGERIILSTSTEKIMLTSGMLGWKTFKRKHRWSFGLQSGTAVTRRKLILFTATTFTTQNGI
jgi:uncharacterized protein YqjF (DUF2071 family)